jgi:hypothetical protein
MAESGLTAWMSLSRSGGTEPDGPALQREEENGALYPDEYIITV